MESSSKGARGQAKQSTGCQRIKPKSTCTWRSKYGAKYKLLGPLAALMLSLSALSHSSGNPVSGASTLLHREAGKSSELTDARGARTRRAATARLDRLWDDAVIPYEIDPIFTDERAALFRSAMRHWENYTCVKFVERDPEEHRNYIVFTERSCGCCSFVGKRGNGAQAISIGKHCDKFGIVVHELGHVVGFWHEHTRPDRDQHVQIIGKNIMSGQEYNFNKLTKDEVNSLGLAYDYDSILHYATNTFAKDTYLDTILPLHGHLNTVEATQVNNGTNNAGTSTGGATEPLHGSASPVIVNRQQAFTNSSLNPHMINDAPPQFSYSQLENDFNSMLHYDPAYPSKARRPRSTPRGPAMMLLDGSVVVSVGKGADKRAYTSSTRSPKNLRQKRESMDGEDSVHMLAMDNMLAKTRPDIGQRVRLSVGDIAQTNLLYRCPKCGRTIQQASGVFHSPEYFSQKFAQRAEPFLSDKLNSEQTGSPSHGQDFCEWRLTVGQGERIMINITDLDLGPPTSGQSVVQLPTRLGLPKMALNEREGNSLGSYLRSSVPELYYNRMIMHNCVTDYIEIRDGYTYHSPLIAKLCGHLASLRDIIKPIVSTGNRLLVSYKTSQASANKGGFLAQHDTLCGGYIMLGNAMLTETQQASYATSQQRPSTLPSAGPPHSINVQQLTQTPDRSGPNTLVVQSVNQKIIINGSSPSENEVLLSSQNNLRYHLQSQQPAPHEESTESTGISTGDTKLATNMTTITSTTVTSTESNSANSPISPTNASLTTPTQKSVDNREIFGWSQWPPINTSVIQSPNWPEHYRHSKECIWQIRANENHQISMRFESFDLESHESCAYDYVEVRDGDSNNNELIGRFCGNRIPEQILSSSQSLMVKFVSDSDTHRSGFLATLQPELDECKLGTHGCSYRCSNAAIPYRCECPNNLELAPDGKNCVPTCGGIITDSAGQISSPAFPDVYPLSTKCLWEILAPPHHRITLNFTHFDLEGQIGQECEYDFVDIRSKIEGGKYVKNGVFCGPHQALIVTSIANVMRIEFNSDNSNQRNGFMANYFIDRDECATNNGGCQHVCTNTLGFYQCSCNNGFVLHENKHDCLEGHCTHSISTSDGTFHSPNFPNFYLPNKECAWVFSTAPGHRIKLIFDQFDLENHQECAYDHVAVFDGESIDDPLMGRFCGSRKPLTLVSSFSTLYLLFRSDATNEKRGFNATHSTVCGGRLQANPNQNDLIFSHPLFDGTTHYNRNEDCEWLIEANYNQRVRIEFTFFALEADNNNCNYDQTIVYDGADDTATQLARLCGSDIPRDQSRITSSGESMLIVFRSDDSINNRGFSLTYTAIETSEDEPVAITLPTGANKYSQSS